MLSVIRREYTAYGKRLVKARRKSQWTIGPNAGVSTSNSSSRHSSSRNSAPNAAGREHHHWAFSSWLAGGGVKPGTVYGETDGVGKKVKLNPVKPEDFLATIGHGLGLNQEEIVYSPTQRPFTFADKGVPVTAVYA